MKINSEKVEGVQSAHVEFVEYERPGNNQKVVKYMSLKLGVMF